VIDFRYHLVSIIAVFLALAVGLLVGAAYLSGPALTLLKREQQTANRENITLQKENGVLSRQVSADQAFAQAGSQRLVGSLLTGEKVVVIEAPGTPDAMANGVITSLQEAGATVTGQVLLQASFLSSAGQTESTLTQLATQAASQAGITLPGTALYPGLTGQQQAAAVIAASVVSKDGTGLAASTSRTILQGFAQPGFLAVKVNGNAATPAPATLAVLLDSAGAEVPSASQGLVAFAAELKAASRATVLAGALNLTPVTDAVSVEASAGTVSTVDNADRESGQIIVVQVLRELLDGKGPASYGVGPQSAPSPAPTPAVTPSSGGSSSGLGTPTPGTSKGTRK
jgi:hypothetical protein